MAPATTPPATIATDLLHSEAENFLYIQASCAYAKAPAPTQLAVIVNAKEFHVSRDTKQPRGDLKSRCPQRGKIEVKLKAMMINTMIDQVA